MSRSNNDLHFAVAGGVVVVYDWVLTIGQEIDLIWRQRWSLMTVMYLGIRYIGIFYSVYVSRPKIDVVLIAHLSQLVPLFCVCLICTVFDSSDWQHTATMMFVSLTDAVSNILFYATNYTNLVITAMLGVIMIARLYAMYERSRTMLIFLVIIFLGINIACGVISALEVSYTAVEELILSGMHICGYDYEENFQLPISMVWMLNTVWEVLALCLSVWIAVKHFRALRRLGPSTGSTIGDCFSVLVKSHVLYFASFVGVSCLQLIKLSPSLLNSISTGVIILDGVNNVLAFVQMIVLGPRLILSVREYHAKLLAGSNPDTSMNSIVFQEHVHISTSGTV
ncbi:hypothetical protein CY34DRAFT_809885 [Suillus luteus UH-Slu-Lm8-n1]|uniref:DUF6533 domain-containing protein n=1 Tax=Suillus luteus UH-Slu-Lm8-n1 TaxID=930992 RepID=A0A0C9ZKC3_9AGAM|nr:hypothetical protein CY34DRAFT_809885 [Suillus luteus UH-Slu-Lm8-n1]